MKKKHKGHIIFQTIPYLDESDVDAVALTIKENWITEGRQSSDFVDALKEIIGVPYGVLAPNGTLALALGIMALGIGAGDEVLVPDITFMGSATAIILAGATPVFVDVERENFQLDVKSAERCISKKTRAIMPVHLYGTSCDMDIIRTFALKHNLLIIEDAAQGMGVCYKNSHVGSFGDVGCFSFFADKTITTGEGGFVACKDKKIYERLCLLRNQGRIDRGSFIHQAVGFNFRMTDMQSALGLSQLRKLNHIINQKQLLWKVYNDGIKKIKEIRLLGAEKSSNHVPFRCVIIAEHATRLQKTLENNGVQVRSFFFPLHMQPCFVKGSSQSIVSRSLGDSQYPNSNFGHKHGLCLPLYPGMELEDVNFIVDLINKFYKKS